VRGLLLLGPSLDVVEGEFDARRMTVPAGVPATIVIGTRDLVASIDDARALQARCPHVQIVTPEDSHELGASGPAVVGALQDLELANRKPAPAPAPKE
jgi:pimeloyl-ACP methyl ester carboxylesterase